MAKRDQQATRTDDSRPLSIGALSRATRIPVETLRTWERRYGSPMPVRKPSGHRVYPATAVDHLRRVGRLLALGHRPAEILGLSARELDRLLSLSAGALAPAEEPTAEAPGAGGPVAGSLDDLMRAARDLDREVLLRELRAGWARGGPLRFLEEVAGPFMTEIGRAWEADEIGVRHEHFASGCLSDFLRGVREPFDARARGPRTVAAMLPGDDHEGGLLMASLVLALRGRRVLYLGANTPLDQIATAARSGDAEAVVVSVSAAVTRARAGAALARLRRALPRRTTLWTGGAGAPAPMKGIERFASLSALDARLAVAG